MKEKSILIHIKNQEALEDFVKLLKDPNLKDQINYSHEIKAMVSEFLNNGWKVYLGTLINFNIENEIYNNLYCVNEDKYYDLTIDEVNKKISTMIVRNVGPLEPMFEKLANYLNYLIINYKGKVINNPKAMLKGMSKYYLGEIEEEKLKDINIIAIPTKIFSNTVTFDEIVKHYPKDREKYLIKSLSGELSNSLKCLKDIDEEFLRYKEPKVQGWIIQPIKEEIWNGEFQFVFLDKQLIYSQEKKYNIDGSEVPSQKNRSISKYTPTDKENEILVNLIKYFENFYNISIDICRIDVMKDENNNLILLEFEMVNPGFFIVYMDENDKDIKKIVESIRLYCEKNLI